MSDTDKGLVHFTSIPCVGGEVEPYSTFLFGFLGNHPFFTRFSWSKSSLIVQKDEKANTPNRVERMMSVTKTEVATPAIPNNRNIHQHFVPQ